jgi:hypothetical protein
VPPKERNLVVLDRYHGTGVCNDVDETVIQAAAAWQLADGPG